ncbi:hypothetical protein CERZMDRAFT_91957 [Cercospora zeae-maydis SCOH1-5]|uniref:Uncharacterized protein n=1 Tax=Cercospora zeae-maydis SCOH1-5 TaxID=717836 RepID=A0A6A6EYN2_9PEZI|nr:hypothetical protein CERZMDRAFT_91957 [Cercospora zeae-maydis SCOH1-5]
MVSEYTYLLCSALLYSAPHRTALDCSALLCSTLLYSTLLYSAQPCTTLHGILCTVYSALQCSPCLNSSPAPVSVLLYALHCPLPRDILSMMQRCKKKRKQKKEEPAQTQYCSVGVADHDAHECSRDVVSPWG